MKIHLQSVTWERIPLSLSPCAGNVFRCNYVVGPEHCYYLDYCTSGVTVEGGACIGVHNGVKLNTGKK